jgi:hypothetical protein
MAAILAVIFSAASFLLVLAGTPAHAAGRARLAPDRDLGLTVEERSLLGKGKIVLREIPSPGRSGRTYEAIGLIQGTLGEAVSVLTDFERYPEFMPNVSAVTLCEQVRPCSVIETTLRLPLGIKKRYRLRYTVASDSPEGFELVWEKLPWPELKPNQTVADTSGFWLVRGFENGRLIVVYHVYTDPGRVPLGLSGIARALAKDKIPDGIVSLRERVRSVFHPAPR